MPNRRVFVSFSSHDGGDFADHIYETYRNFKKFDVFTSPHSIYGGEPFPEKIMNSISNCDFFIVIVTPGVLLKPDWIEREFSEAERLGKRIIPLLYKEIDSEKLDQWTLWKRLIETMQFQKFENKVELIRSLDKILLGNEQHVSHAPPQQYDDGTVPGADPENPYNDPTLPGYNPNLGRKGDASPYPSSNDADAWYNKGFALNEQGRYEEAIAALDNAIEIDPNYASAWNNKGVALDNLGRYEEAISCYDEATELDPSNDIAWNNKGLALDNEEDYEEALLSFQEALRINPNSEIYRDNVRIELEKLRRADDLEYRDKRVSGADPENPYNDPTLPGYNPNFR